MAAKQFVCPNMCLATAESRAEIWPLKYIYVSPVASADVGSRAVILQLWPLIPNDLEPFFLLSSTNFSLLTKITVVIPLRQFRFCHLFLC